MKCLAVLVILLFVTLPVFADSITVNTFALQANPIRLEALGPGLDPLLAPMVIHGGQRGLVFDTSLGPIGSVVFSSTIHLMGMQYTLDPVTIQCSATCGVGYGFLVPVSYKMVQGTLSLTLNGVTETYDFRYQTAVPEPGGVLLLGTGLVGITWKKVRTQAIRSARRLRNRRPSSTTIKKCAIERVARPFWANKGRTLVRTPVSVEKGTNTVISCDSPQFRERTINHLRTNSHVISARK